MTTMSRYLLTLAEWHKTKQIDAEARLRRATTRDCIDANRHAIRFHESVDATLTKIAASIAIIEAATDHIQGH